MTSTTVAMRMMTVMLRRSCSVASTIARAAPATSPVGDPADDGVLGGADRQACQQERDDHADAEIDEHPAPVAGQPERKRRPGPR